MCYHVPCVCVCVCVCVCAGLPLVATYVALWSTRERTVPVRPREQETLPNKLLEGNRGGREGTSLEYQEPKEDASLWTTRLY